MDGTERGSFHVLPEQAIADIAYELTAPSLAGLLLAGADALLATMLENPAVLHPTETRTITLPSQAEADLLLVDLLNELLYLKDAERLLLMVDELLLAEEADGWRLTARCHGERIVPGRQKLLVDVKAATYHLLRVEKTSSGWHGCIVLDL